MKKITERKALDLKCLVLWSTIVRLPQTCAICGKVQSESNHIVFQGHHIVSRRYAAGRWSLDNGLSLCSSCHFWEKVDPEKFRDSVLSSIGKNKFEKLKSKYMKTCKITESDLMVIYTGLKLELKRREKEGKN